MSTPKPRTAHLVYPGGPPCQPNCPGTWSEYHDGYADGYENAEAAAPTPLREALTVEIVEAADVHCGTCPPHGPESSCAEAVIESLRTALATP